MDEKKISDLKKDLSALLKKDALKIGNFVLSSGKVSNYYLDGRIITLTPEGAYLVANIILEMAKDRKIVAIGGPTLGADPIVGAVAVLAHINKMPLKAFIVRKAAKEHGMQRRIEGPELKKGDKVILVDDVATTGKALVEAKNVLGDMGVIVDSAIVIVDRRQGAEENLSKCSCRLEPIFKIEELGV